MNEKNERDTNCVTILTLVVVAWKAKNLATGRDDSVALAKANQQAKVMSKVLNNISELDCGYVCCHCSVDRSAFIPSIRQLLLARKFPKRAILGRYLFGLSSSTRLRKQSSWNISTPICYSTCRRGRRTPLTFCQIH